MSNQSYIGTLVGESTSREFRLAISPGAVREQDIIALDAELTSSNDESNPQPEQIRVWAKVQHIERVNPLFPTEAGHELAATQTNPFDTVLSLSREMVTAVCQVLGYEAKEGNVGGKLNQLRYPAQPATSAYSPASDDIARIVLGELQQKQNRALDVATLANRPDVNVTVDGHAIVTRHLAILAMTGAGKSWAARKIVEELINKHYPIVIFDPHGDYAHLDEVPTLNNRVRKYYAQFPIFEQDSTDVIKVIASLGWEPAKTHLSLFDDLFFGAKAFISNAQELASRTAWLSDHLKNENIRKYGIKPNLFFLADFVQLIVETGKNEDKETFDQIVEWTQKDQLRIAKQMAHWLEPFLANLRTAASRLRQMEEISKKAVQSSDPLPNDRTQLVKYNEISVISLAGYESDFQATIYSLIAESIFNARVSGVLKLQTCFLLEEAHNFAPGSPKTSAEHHAISITKSIAQEGRKFGIGLVLVSQRPSRLDETTLSQCNSYIIMRMVNPSDQKFVRDVVESLAEDEAKMLPDLDVGEALFSGQMINFPVLVKMKKPESRGEREEEDAFELLEETHRRLQRGASK